MHAIFRHPILAVVLALSINFQFTMGARLAASDIAIALLIPVLVLAIRNTQPAPWNAALGACTLILLIGFFRGPMDSWAITKFGGWFLLLAYGGAGLLLGERYQLFAQVYIFTLCIVVICFLCLTAAGIYWGGGPTDPRFSGLIGNPNSFALTLLCGIAMCRDTFRRWEIPTAILVAAIFYTWSLAGIAALAGMAIAWLVWTRNILSFVRIVGMAVVIYAAPIALNSSLHVSNPKIEKIAGRGLIYKLQAIGGFSDSVPQVRRVHDRSIEVRVRLGEQAIDLWRESPVMGVGLGTFWYKHREGGAIIHSTPLWILTEFGLIGLAAFAFLWLLIARILFQRGAMAGILALLGWTLMALPHELMYQRTPWLVLGLTIGAYLRNSNECS